ncbi:unnamed protein product [Linum trigynum]|uniref:Uncharacterized protein n=1 Tax=Linum trigynum TaxID=586398 RepID=A0AAV2CFS1_9ROSI
MSATCHIRSIRLPTGTHPIQLERKSTSLTSEIETFASSTKRLRKLACKTLQSSRKITSPAVDLEPKESIFGLMREVELASSNMFESLLSSVSGAESSGSSVVSKYQKSKRGWSLEGIQWTFRESEEELECVYRKLVKTRVSFINILNH